MRRADERVEDCEWGVADATADDPIAAFFLGGISRPGGGEVEYWKRRGGGMKRGELVRACDDCWTARVDLCCGGGACCETVALLW